MEIITSENLESTGYRCLFECVQQEGIEQVMRFIQDIHKISFQKEIMLRQAIVYGRNDLLGLIKSNLDVVKYLRQHEKDLKKFNFSSKDLLNTLTNLSKNISLLELYLDNAKKLEELKISEIIFSKFPVCNTYKCGIYRNNQGNIIGIDKYYTDGQIDSVGLERVEDEVFRYSEIPFQVYNQNKAESFVLMANNGENGYQYRQIEITDFGFNSSKLPTEEEIRSYEIPKSLIREKRN